MSAAVTLIDVSHASKQQGTSAQVASSPTNSTCNDGEAARQQSASDAESPGADLLKSGASSIVALPDPSNGDERDYLVVPAKIDTGNNSNADTAAIAARAVDIFEVQSCTGPSKYGSYFVGSRVVSDGALRVATRVDPLFFVLAAVEAKMKQAADNSATDPKAKTGPRWQPLNQQLADVPPAVHDALRNASTDAALSPDQIVDKQMRHLFHMTDQYGDDMILYKFDESLALGFLKAKYERALRAAKAGILRASLRDVATKTESAKLGGGGGAFSSAFNTGDDEEDEEVEKAVAVTQSPSSSQGSTTDTSSPASSGGNVAMLSKEDEVKARVAALQLVCEYLSDGWRNKLTEELSMTEEDLLGPRGKKRKAAPATSEDNDDDRIDLDAEEDMTKPPSKWDGGNDAVDKLQQISRGVDGCGGAAGSASAAMMDDEEREKAKKKEEKLNAKSVGLKKLAKVNTKGMKSLTSFFGGPAKKKKKVQ